MSETLLNEVPFDGALLLAGTRLALFATAPRDALSPSTAVHWAPSALRHIPRARTFSLLEEMQCLMCCALCVAHFVRR